MFERTTTTTTTEEEQKEEQKVNTKIVNATVPVHPLGDFDAQIEHRNFQESWEALLDASHEIINRAEDLL